MESPSPVRLLAALLFAAVGGCTQLPSEADVGIGTGYYEPQQAAPFAALYLPYAQMSSLAYADPQFLSASEAQPRLCPLAAQLNDSALADAAHPAKENRQLAQWLTSLEASGWQCIYGGDGIKNCPAGQTCIEGLQYQIWRRRDCKEAVIAFRGSDANDRGDWLSNFRWFRVRSGLDQYDQVQLIGPKIIDRLEQSGCRPATIITTGHSLGGGLAQHVAYADRRVAYVYAFDPSPVTALFGVPVRERMTAVERLGIDRIFEAGEVLSLPRHLVSGLYATPQCQPRVRNVRFNVVPAGSRTELHRMANLTQGLAKLSNGAAPAPSPLALNAAQNCDFVSTSGQM